MPNTPVMAFEPQHAEDDGGLYVSRIAVTADKRSKLQRSKEGIKRGAIVNVCKPYFGCEDHQLDEQGYCRHVVGFTDPNDDRIYFPLKWRSERDGEPKRYRFTDGSDPQLVRKGDVLVLERVACRVYRDVDAPDAEALPSGHPLSVSVTENELAEFRRIAEWAKQNGYLPPEPAQPVE